MNPHTCIVGILNLGPDSFSSDGIHLDPSAALHRIEKMLKDGASVIDIGAESTRPHATPIDAQEEWRRMEKTFSTARRQFPKAIFSIDTYHAETAHRALDLGADWINDVRGFADPAMRSAVRSSDAKLVMMHSLDVPPLPQHTLPETTDLMAYFATFAQARRIALENDGIGWERLIFDPGIGFGKTVQQSWDIIMHAGRLQERLGMPCLIGHSRKSFLNVSSQAVSAKDEKTREVSKILFHQKIAYLRVHDVSGHQALGIYDGK